MAKPKLCLIPASQGSKLFSVLPSSGVGDFDFTRSGSATRINSQGLIETVANGQSRLNYPMIDGKVVGCPHHILEPQRTNLLPYSEDFSNAAWIKLNSTVLANQVISPDGTQNADELQVTTSGGNIYDNVGGSGDGVFSVFAKYKDTQYIRLRSTGSYAFFDIKNGVVGSTLSVIDAKIEEYPNGWYKCSVIGNNTNSLAQIFVSTDGVGTSLGNVYLWGADFQAGSYPTSYIPTNGATATRLADVCNDAGTSDTFNDSEGVLMAEVSALADDNTDRKIGIVQGSTQNQVSIGYSISTKKIRAITYDGVVKGETFTNVYDVLSSNKVAYKYKSGDNVLWVNGFALDTSTNTNILDGVTLNSLNFNASNSDFYGNTKQIQYFDTALTDSEIEELTSWESFLEMAAGQNYTIK